MYHYSMVQWLFFFYFYCFFGWCFESAYVSLKSKKLVNRGFMRGPFLPLYGSGGIMMLVVSAPFQGNTVLVYLAGCVGATLLEYVTGVIMEALFKVRYWDYSDQPFNFQGHICLSSSLAWGFLTIFMTEWLHKKVEAIVFKIPENWMEVIVFAVTVIIVFDFTLSFKAAMDLRDVLIKMEQAKEELQRVQKRLDVIIAVADEEINQKKTEWSEAVELQKAELKENVEGYKEQLKEGINDQKEILRLSMEELKYGINESMEKLRQATVQKPSAYLEGKKEEIEDLYYKYRSTLEKREYLSRLKGFYQRAMMKAHPSMTSVKFKEALEELREKLKEK